MIPGEWDREGDSMALNAFEVEERLLASGEIMTPLDIANAKEVANKMAQSGGEAIAVCLLHSWANPDHEAKIGDPLERDPEKVLRESLEE